MLVALLQLIFYYHLFGPRGAALNVFYRTRTPGELTRVTRVVGQRGDLWVREEAHFAVNASFQIILEGVLGDGPFGDVALDDLELSPGCRPSSGKDRLGARRLSGMLPMLTLILSDALQSLCPKDLSPLCPPQPAEPTSSAVQLEFASHRVKCVTSRGTAGTRLMRPRVLAFAGYAMEGQDIRVAGVTFLHCGVDYRPDEAQGVSCNFDRGLCGWYQDQNDGLDWTLDGRQGLDHTSGTGTLSLKMKLLGDTVETLLWTEMHSHGDEWQHGISTVDPWGREFQLIFEVTRDGFEGDAAVDDVTLVSRPCPARLSCSFEVDACGYSTDGGACWVRQSQHSGAIPHGPTTDHSLETTTGFYAVADTSLGVLQGGQTTVLSSEVRSPSAGMECLSFWYHAGGHNPDERNELRVSIVGAGEWLSSWYFKEPTAGWQEAQISLASPQEFQIVLEATRALGAIAVDDITYEDGRDCQHKPVAASKGVQVDFVVAVVFEVIIVLLFVVTLIGVIVYYWRTRQQSPQQSPAGVDQQTGFENVTYDHHSLDTIEVPVMPVSLPGEETSTA
ncbi:AEGP protein, partial [Polypterus senegalus]